MIELYHFAFSTCSQKVRLVLAEKDLEFASHEVNLIAGEQHAPDYVKLNPHHVVPTLVHDGHVLVESSLIIQYLDDRYADPPLCPTDPLGRYAVGRWLKRADEEVHRAAPIVTFALGPRNAILDQPAELREANIESIPDPVQRATRRSVIEHGVKAPEFAGALGVFLDALDDMENELATHPWMSGDRFGLVDATLLPYVLRLEHLAMDPLLDTTVRPRLADWLARVRARPSYARAVEDWAAPAAVEMMRAGGKPLWPEIEPLTRRDRARG